MPVKSIQVKLHLPRTPDGEAIRKAAALTHVQHNDGVRWHMERLLELRQGDVYEDRDSLKPTRLAGGRRAPASPH